MNSGMWVLDVTLWREDRPLRVWCPIEEDGTVITGLSVMSDVPPHGGKCVAIFHEDGQEEVEAWMESHEPFLNELHVDLQKAGVA